MLDRRAFLAAGGSSLATSWRVMPLAQGAVVTRRSLRGMPAASRSPQRCTARCRREGAAAIRRAQLDPFAGPSIGPGSTPGSGTTPRLGSGAPPRKPHRPRRTRARRGERPKTRNVQHVLSRPTVPAGKVIVEFVNRGQDEHNLHAVEPSEGRSWLASKHRASTPSGPDTQPPSGSYPCSARSRNTWGGRHVGHARVE